MKKILAFLSTILLGISLTACGKMDDKKDDGSKDTQTTANVGAEQAKPADVEQPK